MDNETNTHKQTFNIDSFQLLSRFVGECKELANGLDYYPHSLCSADIITAVYYYRVFPDADTFIEKAFKSSKNYFQLQWVRSMWAKFDDMSNEQLSTLVINQIGSVANLTEEQ